jgi:hypothetical protein
VFNFVGGQVGVIVSVHGWECCCGGGVFDAITVFKRPCCRVRPVTSCRYVSRGDR